jgi:TetR/AcrR family fatty acid metabolism transcriptional regulator
MSERSFRTARRPKRAAKRTGDKRERILDAAVAVFAKTGFHRARVADVAKAAGVADGTIYLYFDSKEDLLVKLFEDRVERLLTHLRVELPKETTATGKLRRVIEVQLGILENERELAEVLTIILRQSTKLMKDRAAPKFGEYIDSIADVVARGQKAGELRSDVSPHVVARAIFGALDGLAMTWALGKAERGGLVRAADQLAGVLLHGLEK